MKIAAIASPIVLGGAPFLLFLVLLFIFGSTPPAAATLLFLGVISGIAGLVLGLVISAILAYRHSKWTKDMRERIAADGIRAEELDWFKRELRSAEKRALNEISRSDPLLADAYRETLASRLTATRIIRRSQTELHLARRRQFKLKHLKAGNSESFLKQAEEDVEKISSINAEARAMLSEAEARLQMIEAAALRGGAMADSELALKKLTARTAELPLALEAARMEDDIRRQLEKETAE